MNILWIVLALASGLAVGILLLLAMVRLLMTQARSTQEDAVSAALKAALAERALLSVGTIKSLEAGKGKLSSLVAVLRELGALEQLDGFIPPVTISPLQMADAGSRQSAKRARTRATAARDKSK